MKEYTLEQWKKKVFECIDVEEVKQVMVELCGIPSPMKLEYKAGEFVYNWLEAEGFNPRKVGLTPERFNVIGTLRGDGSGHNFMFSSHLDTTGPRDKVYGEGDYPEDTWWISKENWNNPWWHEAWIEAGRFVGMGVNNDKGPMVCTLMAAKAIKKAGVPLKGDIYVTACPGEIGQEPVSEYSGMEYCSKEFGAEYLMVHGGLIPDFALEAEGTHFGVNWVECGKAFFKITVYGESVYTPWYVHVDNCADSANPIYKCAPLIEAISKYGKEYEKKYTVDLPGGLVAPKLMIGAIRSSIPYFIIGGSEIAELYVDARLVPDTKPDFLKRELEKICNSLNLKAEVELFLFRNGREADNEAIKPLVDVLKGNHKAVRGYELQKSAPGFSSMWRNENIWNEYLVPSLTYGPSNVSPTIDEIIDCIKVYASTAMEICMKT
ncbi:MAG TPA: M20/M25/M40 family metallo-hydrolase, partial [Syntrophomonas sp.]|nr:M20/M25/M40 family metallo-hydrolase [Syntrophomonas sp.]